MLYSEFVTGTGCKETQKNYQVYKNLEIMYMNSDMSKQEIYEYGKKLVDNSKTEAEIEAEEKAKKEIEGLRMDIESYKRCIELKKHDIEDRKNWLENETNEGRRTYIKNDIKWFKEDIRFNRQKIAESKAKIATLKQLFG